MKENVLRWTAAVLLMIITVMLFGIYLATGNSLWFIGAGISGTIIFFILGDRESKTEIKE